MVKNYKSYKVLLLFHVFLLILFFADIYGSHKYIGVFISLFILVTHEESLLITTNDVILILFGISYVIFAPLNINFGTQDYFSYGVLPFALYKSGSIIGRNFSENILAWLIFLFSLSLSFIYLYSVFYSYSQGGLFETRSVDIMFYNRNGGVNNLTATLVCLHLTPLLIYFPLLVFFRQKIFNKLFLLGSFFSLLALLASLLLSTRTPISLFFVLLIISGLIVLIFLKRFTLSELFVWVALSILAYNLINLDYKNYEVTSAVYYRFMEKDIYEAGDRSTKWIEGIENVYNYPFIHENYRKGFYHNLWLDLRYDAGVITMFLLLIFTFILMRRVFQIFRRNSVSLQYKLILGYTLFTLLISMFLEPVIQGGVVVFYFFLFFGGIVFSNKMYIVHEKF